MPTRWRKKGRLAPSPRDAKGHFIKGTSGNPGGKFHTAHDITALAQQHCPAAILALVEALKYPKERVPAAQVLLDRGYGRPRQEIDATLRGIVGGIDAPPLPESIDDWLARRRADLQRLGDDKQRTTIEHSDAD